jgi:DNA-binding CsgD family transcriptional regulator
MLNIDKLYESILNELEQTTYGNETTHSKDYSKIGDLINEFSKNENSLKIIIDLTKFKILAITDNLEALTGYTMADYENSNILIFLDAIKPEHFSAPVTFIRWGIDVFKNVPAKANFKSMRMHICGIRVTTKDGKEKRVLFRVMPLELAENGYPKICIVTFDFITHLLKINSHWLGRIAYDETHTTKYHILSTDKKHMYQDIITEREKDVLKLVADGLESKEIAQQLFISLNTVDNHRRNAVTRTGAKDTTALIQICKMCGIF